MAKKIYVGNLSFSTKEETLQNLFSQYGEVVSVNIIYDKFTNQSKGFGFVVMDDDKAAIDAIATLNGKPLDNRRLRVKEAEPRELNEKKNFRNYNHDINQKHRFDRRDTKSRFY
ncbi:MAG: RNA-binding protein [Treponema sp.]|nr:RNA-binding protein [Treponema sp.]